MSFIDRAAAAFNRGNACLDCGDTAAAITAFQRCLVFAPDHPATLYNLANAQLRAGQLAAGAETLVRCLRLAPDFGDAYVNLATALLGLGLLDQARQMAQVATALMPGSPEALLCLAGILHHSGDQSAAVLAYAQALHYSPGHAGALSSMANTLLAIGRIDEALAAHDHAIAADDGHCSEHATHRFNRACTLLATGAFADGWAEYEWRLRRPGYQPRFSAPPWRGEALEGRTILLHWEQGLGDTLQFARYAPLVAERGGRVVLQVQPGLVRLMRTLSGVDLVIGRDEPTPPFDLHCPLMSLPLAFGTTLDQVPAAMPYLRADPADTTKWWQFARDCSPRGDGLRVGLVWRGAPHLDNSDARLVDQRRSIDPADLAGLAHLPDVRFFSLQKDVRPPTIAGLEMIDAMAEMNDFADTAALVMALDLVVCVDTSVAHLAAALGRPVWLLSRYDGCWRWLRDRDDSPWYPTLRIYRQARPNDWPEVILRVRSDLATIAATGWASGSLLPSIE